MNDNRNTYAVHEARVRNFDLTTMVATVVLPGVYGMEPIECPPFTRKGTAVPTSMEPLQIGDRVLVVQGENEVPEWLSANPDRYISAWNTAWGVMAMFPRLSADSTLSGTYSELATPISFTFQSGRQYRVNVYIRALSPSATGGAISVKLMDGATDLVGTYGGASHTFTIASTNYPFLYGQWIINGTGQTHSQLRVMGSAPTGTIAHVMINSAFYVEDVGPVTRLPGDMPSPEDFGWTAYDARFVNTVGDSMTGDLYTSGAFIANRRANANGNPSIRLLTDGGQAYLDATNQVGTRIGYLTYNESGSVVLASDSGSGTVAFSVNGIRFIVSSTTVTSTLPVVIPLTPTATTHAASKGYVDDLATVSACNSTAYSSNMTMKATKIRTSASTAMVHIFGACANSKGSAWVNGDHFATVEPSWYRPSGTGSYPMWNLSGNSGVICTIAADGGIRHSGGTVNNGQYVSIYVSYEIAI